MSNYFSIAAPVANELKVKDSRFIAWLCPVETRERAETALSDRARQFHDATHNCYAFRVGFDDRLIAKSSDAGEPAGTAGRPILQALENRHLTNVLAVVTRYFGGTKLGTGGLVRAYSAATFAAIDLATLLPVFLQQSLRLRYAYSQSAVVQNILRRMEAKIIHSDFGVEIEQVIELRAPRLEEAKRLLRDACAGKIFMNEVEKPRE
jgi:uncharacterized YigZ family protein